MPTTFFSLPVDANGKTVSLVPSKTSAAGTTLASLGTAGTYTFGTVTPPEMIEVSAVGQGIYIKWGTTVASSSVMDGFIAAGQTRQYVIPTQTTGSPGARFAQMTLKEFAASGTAVIIEY